MSDESFAAPGFLEQGEPSRDASASKEPPGLASGTALSVLWWITEDDAEDALDDSASGPGFPPKAGAQNRDPAR